MNSDELQLCQALLAGYLGGDELTDELLSAAYDPHVEVHEAPDLPGGTVWRGYDGVRGLIDEMWQRWEWIDIEPEEWIERPGAVLMLGTQKLAGKGAGVPVSSPLGMVFEFTDGRVCRLRYYRSQQQALDAADAIDAEVADA